MWEYGNREGLICELQGTKFSKALDIPDNVWCGSLYASGESQVPWCPAALSTSHVWEWVFSVKAPGTTFGPPLEPFPPPWVHSTKWEREKMRASFKTWRLQYDCRPPDLVASKRSDLDQCCAKSWIILIHKMQTTKIWCSYSPSSIFSEYTTFTIWGDLLTHENL